jgi:hypothetical protein
MVGRLGFEPRTNDLKGRCSTIELSTPEPSKGAKMGFRALGLQEISPLRIVAGH